MGAWLSPRPLAVGEAIRVKCCGLGCRWNRNKPLFYEGWHRMQIRAETLRGFNYQPSYGTTGLELWMRFDAGVIRRELSLGKKYFPGMQALRLWLSWDAFQRDPQRFLAHFEALLALCSELQLAAMPVLFNRWHDFVLDYGGLYSDHFMAWKSNPNLFVDYIRQVVGGHAEDPRVFAWDLCNEPNPSKQFPELGKLEYDWLAGMYAACKSVGAVAPITVGSHQTCHVRTVEPMSDWLSIHPYLIQDTPGHRVQFQAMLDDYVAVAKETGKPLMATETCWGSLSDAAREENARFTLGELKKRNIGWLAYLLHHSMIADAHRPEFGPVGIPGNLAFIEAGGEIRPGHAFFNEY